MIVTERRKVRVRNGKMSSRGPLNARRKKIELLTPRSKEYINGSVVCIRVKGIRVIRIRDSRHGASFIAFDNGLLLSPTEDDTAAFECNYRKQLQPLPPCQELP